MKNILSDKSAPKMAPPRLSAETRLNIDLDCVTISVPEGYDVGEVGLRVRVRRRLGRTRRLRGAHGQLVR